MKNKILLYVLKTIILPWLKELAANTETTLDDKAISYLDPIITSVYEYVLKDKIPKV